ncbi:MAG: hypothetical protein WCH84_07395 [Verrucomicrobiota bacterium]
MVLVNKRWLSWAIRTAISAIAICGLAGQNVSGKDPVGSPGLPPEENVLILQFQQTLKNQQWDKALEFCSDRVRKAAAANQSPEVFLRKTIPIAELVDAKSFPECGLSWRGNPVDSSSLVVTHCLALPANLEAEAIQWRWKTSQVNHQWVIDFEVLPLCEVIERVSKEKAALRHCQAATELALAKVKVRLSGLNQKYIAGQPMLFRLEIVNESDSDLVYDSQQVAVNWPLNVVDSDGKTVECIGSCSQTFGSYRRIKAGETNVLFDSLNLASQYDMHKPGRYTVQYCGRGLEIGLPRPPEAGIGYERQACSSLKKVLSNPITIDVTNAAEK